MNTDEMLRDTFRGLEDQASGLDPARVIAGAKRRRVRRIAATATASATVVAAVATAFTVYPSNEPAPVAGPSTDSLSVIENRTWTQLDDGPQWFYIDGRIWKLGPRPDSGVWLGNSAALPGGTRDNFWSSLISGGTGDDWYAAFFLPGDVTRVEYTIRGGTTTKEVEAKVYRLASAPDRILAYADHPAPGPISPDKSAGRLTVTVDAFNAAGDLIIRCDREPRQASKTAPAKPACRRVR